MFSELRPHFEKIERYYHEINVSLRVEEECLRKISSSLRVTPGDKLRWENIRDACWAASTLLTPGVGPISAPSLGSLSLTAGQPGTAVTASTNSE